MRITDSGVMRAAVVRLQVDVRGQSDGSGWLEKMLMSTSRPLWREGIPTEAS
jgi:hypothetical protein